MWGLLWLSLSAGCHLDGATVDKAPDATSRLEMSRDEFHMLASELGYPLFWLYDDVPVGQLQPHELVSYWGPWRDEPDRWVRDGAFTDEANTALRAIQAAAQASSNASVEDETEALRREAVRASLRRARLVMVHSDLSGLPDTQKQMVRHLLEAGRQVERVYARQRGMLGAWEAIPADDGSSRMLLFRNQSVECGGEDSERCRALPSSWTADDTVYPNSLQEEGYCARLQKDHSELMGPFSVIQQRADGSLTDVPYVEAYPDEMAEVAGLLTQAADALGEGEEEALEDYLRAASAAFRTGDWFAADEAWAAVTHDNSDWMIRVGPDDAYWDECHRKAGFQLVVARTNPRSLRWQERLEPERQSLEEAIAALSGEDYQVREVDFRLPDFVDIVLNAGDARPPTGGTIGMSLPNWGPHAGKGARTLAMTNLFRDADSVAMERERAATVLCADAIGDVSGDDEPVLLSTVLHEMTHGLGPGGTHRVNGRLDVQIFGGALAGVLEELKAQVGAMHLMTVLERRGVVDERFKRQARVADLLWSVGKWLDPMYTSDGQPRSYAQLSAIVLGRLHQAGAIAWRADELSADRQHRGCLSLNSERVDLAVEALGRDVLELKARGDRSAAERLVGEWVQASAGVGGPSHPSLSFQETLRARWRAPQDETLVYTIQL